MSTAAAPTTRVESVLQRAELELWRDNIDGALDLLARAHTLAPDHRYAARAEEIRSWLTRKTVRRVVEYPEYQWLEREIIERRPARVLDAGCGEGRIALCLGHRCPSIRVTAVEVSATNVGIARRLNRFRNVAFQHGLVEDVVGAMAPGSFDLGYSFAVLEHVPDVETTVGALLRTLRPGGRFCFAVAMNELMATGPVPAFQPLAGVAGPVPGFTEVGLRERFGRLPGFSLRKLPGRWRPGRYPATIAPLEYGAFFIAVSAP